MAIRIKDNTQKYLRNSDIGLDKALAAMASDIERMSKLQVPRLHGQLRASGYARRVDYLVYQVIYNKEYAAYQHEGSRADGSHIIKKHTKAGSKTHFLIDPANEILKKRDDYIKRFQP